MRLFPRKLEGMLTIDVPGKAQSKTPGTFKAWFIGNLIILWQVK